MNAKLLGLMMVAGTMITSCLDTDDSVEPITPFGSVAMSNFSPGADGLKFYSNGEAMHDGTLNYGSFNGFWRGDVGIHSITVNSGSTVLDTLNVTIGLNRFYSIFAVNTPGNTELISFEENFIIPDAGKAAIHFYQLSPDAPSLKVAIAGETSNLGTYLFKQASSFMEINEAINKRMYLIDHATSDTLLSKLVTFSNGKSYSVVSKGLVNTTNENEGLDIQIIPFNL